MSDSFLTIVSGLPRSGTSMMMGALQAGGLELVTDGKRQPDEFNSHGYFEHEKVKVLEQDPTWLSKHLGKAVKILFHKLEFVPSELPARVLFMERDLAAVVASQDRMLGQTSERDWTSVLSSELERVKETVRLQHPNLRFLEVRYSSVLSSPGKSFEEINTFLDGELDVQAMVKTVRRS